jgi:DNA-binding SARP family transcriptional activator
LAAAVAQLSWLTEDRLLDAIHRVLRDLDNTAEYTSTDAAAGTELRTGRADYHRLAAELESAARSLRVIERALGGRIDAADRGRRIETADPGTRVRHLSERGRRGWRRWLPGQGRGCASAVDKLEHPSLERAEPTGDARLARSHVNPSSEIHDADIAAWVLGPLELTVAGVRVLSWTSLKARAIFQYLLLHQGRPVRREILMELEWPDHSQNSARNNLNVALYNLRNTFDGRGLNVQAILHKEGCYLLNPALTCWIDRNEFLSILHDAQLARRAGYTQRAIYACRSAVQLYRGPLFEDDLGGEWYLAEQRHLKELYLQALEYLAESHYNLNQLSPAIELGQLAISTDPCCESVHRLLMRCYARQHQQQLVSRQFRLCTAALHDELGVPPTTETVQLFRTLTSTT